jgi:mannose-1-phosphate guanylyltransferase
MGAATSPSGNTLADVYITILAGGSGTRLWPYSRAERPKQLLPIAGDRSLLQQTVARVLPLVPVERIYILTGPEHAAAIAAQLPDLPEGNILVEPAPRGTAPCLGLAALRLREVAGTDDAVMISLHADHVIADEPAFRQALSAAAALARQGVIATLGIVPTHAETGFGYIERGAPLGPLQGLEAYRVESFREKPPLEVATEYVESGRFFWNAGYFAWTLGRIRADFGLYLPETLAALRRLVAMDDATSPDYAAVWNAIRPVTIDVGILERARQIGVIPCELGWNDVGNWATLLDILPRDAQGNAHLGAGQHVAVDTRSSLVFSSGRMVVTLGLEDTVVVDAGDVVLVLPKERAQDVSALVRELRDRGLQQYL